MFPKASRYALFFLFLISSVFLGYTCMASKTEKEQDLLKYQKKGEGQSVKNCYQLREGVCKEIWLAEEEGLRKSNRIKSRFSKLSLLPQEEKIDIIESMYQIRGWIQEKLYQEGSTVSQQLRYFEAEHGTYQYIPQTFVTGNLSLSLYKLSGTGIPEVCRPADAFLRGVAEGASFTISGKTPVFEATKFQARLTKATP